METLEIIEEQVQPASEAQEKAEKIEIDSLGNGKIGRGEKPTLDGETVEISAVDLIKKNEELKTQDGNHVYRNVILRVSYGEKGYENYGGIRQFQDQGTGNWKEPSLWVNGRSAAAALFKSWCIHTTKSARDVSLKEFLRSLIGMKGTIETRTVTYNGEEYKKNQIAEFVDEQTMKDENKATEKVRA